MAGQMIVQVVQADGNIREVVVENGQRLTLGSNERLLVAADPDQTRMTSEADGATTIVLEGLGEFTVENAGEIPQDPVGIQVARAPLAVGAPRPVIIFETVGSDPRGEDGSVSLEPLGIHEASAGDTGFMDQFVDTNLGMNEMVELAAFHAEEVGGINDPASGREDEQGSLYELDDQDAQGQGPRQNHAPVANPVDLGSMNEDGGSVTITTAQLLSGASDVDGDELTLQGLSLATPGSGTLTDNGNGTWTFAPTANWNGDLSFSYQVSDGHGGSAAGTASLKVNAVNDAPTTGLVDLESVSEGESLLITMDQLVSKAHDVDGDVLTAQGLSLSDPAAGTLTDNGDDTWTFTPTANWNGEVRFSYQVSDGDLSTLGSARLTVGDLAANHPPVAGDVDLQDVHQGTSLTIYASELLANSHDIDSGDTLSITGLTLSNPAAGTLVDNGNGTWTFTPNAGFVGDDVAFSFTVSDGRGGTDTGMALVDVVSGPNHPPVVNPVDLGTMNEDGSLTFTSASLLGQASDLDGDTLTVTSVTVDPFYGVVTDNGDGTWTFTPKADYYGANVGMTFTVSDGKGGIGSSVAVVDVLSVNDAPVTGNVNLGSMNEDGGSVIITKAQLLSNAYDVDGDVLTASGLTLSDPGAGTLTDNGNGTWTFTPTAEWSGNLSFSYQVSDGNLSTLGTASLRVIR